MFLEPKVLSKVEELEGAVDPFASEAFGARSK